MVGEEFHQGLLIFYIMASILGIIFTIIGIQANKNKK